MSRDDLPCDVQDCGGWAQLGNVNKHRSRDSYSRYGPFRRDVTRATPSTCRHPHSTPRHQPPNHFITLNRLSLSRERLEEQQTHLT